MGSVVDDFVDNLQGLINDYKRLKRREFEFDEALREIESAKAELIKPHMPKLTTANRINPFYGSDILVVMQQDGSKKTLVELCDDELDKLMLHISCVVEGRK